MTSRPQPLIWYMTQGYAVRGGHEAHVLHYATELRRHGFDTRVVVLNEPPRTEHLFMQLLRTRGIPLEFVRPARGLQIGVAMLLLAPGWGAWMLARGKRPRWELLRNHISDRVAARALRRKLAVQRPDLIHILGRLADYAWPELPAERCVLHHGTEGRRDATWDAAEFAAFRGFAQRAACNFAPGQGVADNVRREFQIERPIDTIYTICPDEPGAAEPRDFRATPQFGMLCRMTPEKGISVVLEALRRYRDRHGDVQFCFAGRGELEREIEMFVAQHSLTHVQLRREFDSPASVLRDWDVFVHPSLSDAMPLAIAEALMCGLPCVVTRVGGIPDLVRDGQEGFIVAPDDAGAIVAAMERFAGMPAPERQAFGARARARYEAVCRPGQVGAVVAGHYRAVLAAVGRNAG